MSSSSGSSTERQCRLAAITIYFSIYGIQDRGKNKFHIHAWCMTFLIFSCILSNNPFMQLSSVLVHCKVSFKRNISHHGKFVQPVLITFRDNALAYVIHFSTKKRYFIATLAAQDYSQHTAPYIAWRTTTQTHYIVMFLFIKKK